MTLRETMAALESMGTAQNRKLCARRGSEGRRQSRRPPAPLGRSEAPPRLKEPPHPAAETVLRRMPPPQPCLNGTAFFWMYWSSFDGSGPM